MSFERAVGVDRRGHEVLRHRDDFGLAVDCGGGGEDDVLHPAMHRSLDERPGLDRVGQIVAERVGHRIRHHDLGGEMRQHIDSVFGDDPFHQGLIGHIAHHQCHVGGKHPVEAGGQIIDDDDVLVAGIQQRQHHVAADISRAARHQNRHGPTSIPAHVAEDIPQTLRVIMRRFRLSRAWKWFCSCSLHHDNVLSSLASGLFPPHFKRPGPA